MGARRLALGFHRVDGRVEHIAVGTARPTRDPRHLAKLFAAKLATIDPGLGVEDMILAVFAVEKLEPEQLASRLRDPPPLAGEGVRRVSGGQEGASSEIASLLDRLGNRFGLDAISHIEPRQSHIPERASIYVPVNGKKDAASTPSPPPGALRKNRLCRGPQKAAPPPPCGGGGDPGLDPGEPEGAGAAARSALRRIPSDSSCVSSGSRAPPPLLPMVPLPRPARGRPHRRAQDDN